MTIENIEFYKLNRIGDVVLSREFTLKLERAILNENMSDIEHISLITDINELRLGRDKEHPLLYVAKLAKQDKIDIKFAQHIVRDFLKKGVDMLEHMNVSATKTLASEVVGANVFDKSTTQLLLTHAFYQSMQQIGTSSKDIIREASSVIVHDNKEISFSNVIVNPPHQTIFSAVRDLEHDLNAGSFEEQALLKAIKNEVISIDEMLTIIENHDLELGARAHQRAMSNVEEKQKIKKKGANMKDEYMEVAVKLEDKENRDISDDKIIEDDIDIAKLIIAEMQEKYVGQDGPINQAKTLLARIQFDRATGNDDKARSMHMRFEGNPGTLKTTMAREYSELLHALSLSNGKFIELTREKIVGAHIGETEKKISEFIESAIGGVLFIDEVHNLVVENAGDKRDFGFRVIEALVGAMERHRDELTVIVAGYSGDIERFLAADPGLRDRFTTTVKFDDYDADTLATIMDVHLTKHNLIMPEDVKKRAVEGILEYKAKLGEREFGNGRVVRNLVEQLPDAMATRIFGSDDVDTSNLSKEKLRTVHMSDIDKYIDGLNRSAEGIVKIRNRSKTMMKDDSYGRNKIGFTAKIT